MTPLVKEIKKKKTGVNKVIVMKRNITVIFPTAQKHSWHVTSLC